jgi:hypothetical protein
MADDPKRRGSPDNKRVSQQKHEQDYQNRKKEGKTASTKKK